VLEKRIAERAYVKKTGGAGRETNADWHLVKGTAWYPLPMPQVTVREMQPQDQEGYLNVVSTTYNSGNPISVSEDFLESRTLRFVAENQDRIVGSFNIVPMTCSRGPGMLQSSGVAAVAVLPHVRRLGVGNEMMKFWVCEARRRGIQMAALYGFSERYYRQFGYEVCGKRTKITCPTERLPRVDSGLPLRQLTPDRWVELDDCLTAFAANHSGVSLRDEALWKHTLAEHRPLKIYVAGDPVEAYAVVSHKTDFWSTDQISEFVWATPRGYLGVLEVLRGLAVNKKAVSWYEPSDSPFMIRFLDTDVTTEIVRPAMFRVCDVPGAIGNLKPAESCDFSIEIHDDLIEENCGCWRVTAEDGVVTATKGERADLSLDIRQFAQALLGEPSLAEIRKAGLVEVRDEAGFAEACRLFSPSPVVCTEFF
jgi:predicted acetyltransferase